jgi:hypothetical protein
MHPKQLDLRQRLYLASLLILVVGLCTAATLYVTMDNSEAAEDTYRIMIYNGKSYPIPVDSDRLYLRNLEQFGGKAAVLFAQFNRWFISLWRGKALAVTVLWITVIASVVAFVLARSVLEPAPGEDQHRDGSQDR